MNNTKYQVIEICNGIEYPISVEYNTLEDAEEYRRKCIDTYWRREFFIKEIYTKASQEYWKARNEAEKSWASDKRSI